MSHLIESIQSLVSAELMSATAASTGESETQLSKAMNAILPTLLSGLLQSNPANHAQLNEMAMKAAENTRFIDELADDLRSGNAASANFNIGAHFISGIFENKAGGIAHLISDFSAIQTSSATTLTGICGALLACFSGKKMRNDGLNFNGLLNWFSDQRDAIESAMPSSFSGFIRQTGTAHKSAAYGPSSEFPGTDDKEDGTKWLLPLLLVVFLGVGIWYWTMSGQTNGTDRSPKAPSTDSTTHSSDSAAKVNEAAKDSAMQGKTELITDSLQSSKDSILKKDSL